MREKPEFSQIFNLNNLCVFALRLNFASETGVECNLSKKHISYLVNKEGIRLVLT